MNAEDILRHFKPQTDEENYLKETIKDVFQDLYELQEVLADYSLSYEPKMLNYELKEAFDHILDCENEITELKEQIERLENEQAI